MKSRRCFPVTLQRMGYRSDTPGEPSVFPLEETLGLRCGCTPALAERVGFHAGQAGATQRTVLELLQREHGITMGVGRLRELPESLSRRVLKQEPNAIHRILHSAAALKQRYGMKNKTQAAAFETACSYLRRPSAWMRYHAFRKADLIGSGVTEAACKTLFTQRVKLSGMRWKRSGLQTVLNLRMLVLSGVWAEVYARTLTPPHITILPAQPRVSPKITRKVA